MSKLYIASEKMNDFFESRTGLILVSLLLFLAYATYSLLHPSGLHAIGIYLFGLAAPSAILIYLARQKGKRILPASILVIAVCLAILDIAQRKGMLTF